MSLVLNAPTVAGGPTLLSDPVAGVDAQIVKLGFSPGGVAPVQVSNTNPLPVTVANSVAGQQDNAPFIEGTGIGLPVMAMGNDTSPASATEGNAGIVRMTLDRMLRTAVTEESGFVKYLGINYAVQYATIAAASSGNNTIVAAVASQRIRVLAMDMMASAAVNGKFQSGAGGTDLTGLAYMNLGGGLVRQFNKHGWFTTAAGALLNLSLSAAVAVGGCIVYIVTP